MIYTNKSLKLKIDCFSLHFENKIYTIQLQTEEQYVLYNANFKFIALKGEYAAAAEHFEAYHKLAIQNRDWTTADGISFLTDACINLSRIYTTLGTKAEPDDMELMLENLTKAYNMAKESKHCIFFMQCLNLKKGFHCW